MTIGRTRRWLMSTSDRGSTSVEQLASISFLLFIMALSVVGGQYWHAHHIVQSAATRALEAARADGATAADGTEQGEASLAALGGKLIGNPHVAVTRTATEVRVEITATANGLVPLPIKVIRTGPVDRFAPMPVGG